jgi:hypothetical protein
MQTYSTVATQTCSATHVTMEPSLHTVSWPPLSFHCHISLQSDVASQRFPIRFTASALWRVTQCNISTIRAMENHRVLKIPSISVLQLNRIFYTSGPLTNLTPLSWVLLDKPPVAQILKNFPTFYETQRFITVFTSARHRSLYWVRWIRPYHPNLSLYDPF